MMFVAFDSVGENNVNVDPNADRDDTPERQLAHASFTVLKNSEEVVQTIVCSPLL